MQPETETHDVPLTLQVESPAFAMNGSIPIQFTADDADIAPPLAWSNAPEGTQGFAIIVEDPDVPSPDAPTTTRAHWIVTGIPGSTTSIEAGARLPDRAVEGTNDFGTRGWKGPDPEVGRHRYLFKVYALDVILDAPPTITRRELLGTMKGHVLAMGQLIGTYEKPREYRSEETKGAERRPASHR